MVHKESRVARPPSGHAPVRMWRYSPPEADLRAGKLVPSSLDPKELVTVTCVEELGQRAGKELPGVVLR